VILYKAIASARRRTSPVRRGSIEKTTRQSVGGAGFVLTSRMETSGRPTASQPVFITTIRVCRPRPDSAAATRPDATTDTAASIPTRYHGSRQLSSHGRVRRSRERAQRGVVGRRPRRGDATVDDVPRDGGSRRDGRRQNADRRGVTRAVRTVRGARPTVGGRRRAPDRPVAPRLGHRAAAVGRRRRGRGRTRGAGVRDHPRAGPSV
jgi:hypothetical protein